MNTITALRMCLVAADADRSRLSHAMFHAYWADDRDLADREVLVEIADTLGLDGAALADGTRDPAIKARLIGNTSAAVTAGAFGAPTFLVGDELFFGQDRLHFVAAALGRSAR